MPGCRQCTWTRGDGVDIDVLGPLDVRENGVSVTPTAPKPRQVLALLASHADRVVPVASLVEELWCDRPPRSARAPPCRPTCCTCANSSTRRRPRHRTRRRHRAGTPDRQGRAPHPARGTCSPPATAEVTSASSSGWPDWVTGPWTPVTWPVPPRTLAAALDLWSGSAFADVQTGARLSMEARRLEESRLCALEQRIEADLRLGRHREVPRRTDGPGEPSPHAREPARPVHDRAVPLRAAG